MTSFKIEDISVGQLVITHHGFIGEVVSITGVGNAEIKVIAYLHRASTSNIVPVGMTWACQPRFISQIIGITENFDTPVVDTEEVTERELSEFSAEIGADIKFTGNREDFNEFVSGTSALFEVMAKLK
jgi:hypothetical protein